MRREWEPEDLIASWTLVVRDWELVANRTGGTRPGRRAAQISGIDGRSPENGAEVPEQATTYLAEQVKVDPALFTKYEFSFATAKYHRAQIRQELRFRECTKVDQVELAGWLPRELCPSKFHREQLRDAVIARCRALRVEPPTYGQLS